MGWVDFNDWIGVQKEEWRMIPKFLPLAARQGEMIGNVYGRYWGKEGGSSIGHAEFEVLGGKVQWA